MELTVDLIDLFKVTFNTEIINRVPQETLNVAQNERFSI